VHDEGKRVFNMPLFGPPNIHQLEAKRDVQGLIKALNFKDPAIRMAAAEALGPLKDPLAVEPLVGLLKDDNAGVRRAAVAALAARGGHRVVEPLVAALEDARSDVRATAAAAVYRRLMTDADAETRRTTAAALGRLRVADAVEPLARATMDSDETVRVAAIKALQAIRDVDAIVPLIIVLAHEQVRQKSSGRSSLPVERATSQALDILCDEHGIEALQTAIRHEDADVREIAVRRLARIQSPLVTESLVGALADKDPGIRRAAARGLTELKWMPATDESGVRYWAALREWRRCVECGAVGIPLLVASLDAVDTLERADIMAALIQLDWQPSEANAAAAQYWAARGQWDKCVAIGEPAIEALDGVLRSAPKWRDRVAAAGALVSMDQLRTVPFARLDLVQRALEILDDPAFGEDRRSLLETLLTDEGQFQRGKQSVEWCTCGYPASRVAPEGLHEPITDLLGSEKSSGNARTYYCPSCGVRRTTVAG
jgi:HEAT repeat protein